MKPLRLLIALTSLCVGFCTIPSIKISAADISPTLPELPYLGAAQIHIFGDSHAHFSFQNVKGCTIHWLPDITMHRVGRDSISFLNLLQYDVRENDTAIFVFGEIDVRCHVAKQCAAGRTLDNVVTTLAEKYIATILKNKALYHKLHCVVFAVLPPTDASYNPEFPYRGTLNERVMFTESLNQELYRQCKAHGIHILDVTQSYKTAEGYFNLHLSDGRVHIGHNATGPVRDKLYALLNEIYRQDGR